jgi:hypothetical protein
MMWRLAPLFLLLVSCAHDRFQTHCENTDWYGRAYAAAASGQSLRDDGELLRACEKHGDSRKYFSETERGLKEGQAAFAADPRRKSEIRQVEKLRN